MLPPIAVTKAHQVRFSVYDFCKNPAETGAVQKQRAGVSARISIKRWRVRSRSRNE